jgi:hypothetical protein
VSRGTRVHTVRIPPDLRAQLNEVIERSIHTRAAGQWTLTDLILTGLQEKLDHMQRSNRPRRRRSKGKRTLASLQCSHCLKDMCLDDCGSFTNHPDFGWIAECWECLELLSQIPKTIGNSDKDS